jgi:hypothetical protein
MARLEPAARSTGSPSFGLAARVLDAERSAHREACAEADEHEPDADDPAVVRPGPLPESASATASTAPRLRDILVYRASTCPEARETG